MPDTNYIGTWRGIVGADPFIPPILAHSVSGRLLTGPGLSRVHTGTHPVLALMMSANVNGAAHKMQGQGPESA